MDDGSRHGTVKERAGDGERGTQRMSMSGSRSIAVSVLMLVALAIPSFKNPWVDAAAITRADTALLPRQSDSSDPTSVCKRWSHQSALVNGTIYIYGGRATTDQDQTTNEWNNDFLSLDLTKTFQIGSPTFKTLPSASGPPAIANGFLWNSLTSLWLYGGEFSDTPVTTPSPLSVWEYDVSGSRWNEHESPQTSDGNNSESGNQPVQRAAEGAGLSIPELGTGYYFGGHLDMYTTPGWANSIARVYVKSLLEFTFPGYTNQGVKSLAGGKKAGGDGAYRNITEGGLQAQGGFPERADGILVYVPGFGQQGIILGLAGGTNASFTQMNIVDVYDIATSTWYKQATSGTTPKARVNPCAVVAAAADGTSFNIYMYGGQNLVPYAQQVQYDDIWILTIPSFTWVQVKTDGQSEPPARAGHTCNVWDSQMVVVGGYVGQDLSCDSPGVYVFDLSELKWQTSFTALNAGKGNDQNQQPAQEAGSQDDAKQPGLSGSYGYKVPGAVQSVVGGHSDGGATATTPVQSATAGPLATGKPPKFTVTASNGAVVTQTGAPGSTSPAAAAQANPGPNVGAIVAGVVAGIFALIAGYFAFCAWVYRRQLALYKRHVAMTQRQAAAGADAEGAEKAAGLLPGSSRGAGAAGGPFFTAPGKLSSNDTSSGPSSGPSTGPSSHPSGPSGYSSVPTGDPTPPEGHSTTNSSTDDLMAGQEPSFLGVLLAPRRSLRVINRD